MNTNNSTHETLTRRNFLRQTAAGTAVAVAATARPGYTAENNTIKVALVGCGGRGSGAADNALATKGPTHLVAMADIFEDRLNTSKANLAKKFSEKVDVPAERCFIGFDAYKKAVEAAGPGGVVILGTPPAFRPLHVEYAVSKGCHVFMEKSFGTDSPGVRRIVKAGEAAKAKNLKIVGGLMSRHNERLQELMKRLHDGAIGDIVTLWAYRMHGPVGYRTRDPKMSELGHQIRNYNSFTWTNGSFLLDWMIHDLDVCCWAKNAWPVSAQGMGGRQTRTEPDQVFDHLAVEYRFSDGTRMLAQGRHMANCWGYFADVAHGTKGTAYFGVVGDGSAKPRTYRGYNMTPENVTWQGEKAGNPYQLEHDDLFDAIRNDKPLNEADRCAKACMTGLMGRMAFESGQEITWDQAWNSTVELAPGLDDFTMNSPAPVQPDANGQYPVAKPGVTKPA